MKIPITSLILLLLFIINASAQNQASVNQKFAWDQAALTLADAQGYTYKYYADGSTTGINFAGIACTGSASPFVCSVSIPAFTPGNHTITITASNIAGESPKSIPFAFAFVVTPAVPTGIRIQ